MAVPQRPYVAVLFEQLQEDVAAMRVELDALRERVTELGAGDGQVAARQRPAGRRSS